MPTLTLKEMIEKGVQELQSNMEVLRKNLESDIYKGIAAMQEGIKEGLDTIENKLAGLQQKLKESKETSPSDARENLNKLVEEAKGLHIKIQHTRKKITAQIGDHVETMRGDAKPYMKKITLNAQNALSELDKEVRELITEVHKRLK